MQGKARFYPAVFMMLIALVFSGLLAGNAPNLASPTSAGPTATPTPSPFSHPLQFPPVTSDANVQVSIDEACVQILDGPCTNMWTYGGTYPGLTIRRPTGHITNVTFTNNLDPSAGSLTVHNHGNHSSPENDGQPEHFLIETGESRT
jgi:FtsP/CotA-like multicopper oxidase with cupredoxin domain